HHLTWGPPRSVRIRVTISIAWRGRFGLSPKSSSRFRKRPSRIGMARSGMARFKLPTVKSWCEPWIASRMELQNVIGSGAMPTCFIFVTGSFRKDPGEDRFRYCRNRNVAEQQESLICASGGRTKGDLSKDRNALAQPFRSSAQNARPQTETARHKEASGNP